MDVPSRALARRRLLLLAVFVASGFAGLIYQSVWAQYLGLYLGHAAFSQSLVLAIFMGGMALGALIVARVGAAWRDLVRAYALVEGLIGLAGLGFHTAFTGVVELSYQHWFPWLGDPDAVAALRWALAAALILPQSLLLGMTFPLLSVGLLRRFPGADGHTLGSLYFANSIGAAVGVLVAAFVLLPAGGLPGAMLAAGLLNLAVAVAAWWLGGAVTQAAPRRPAAPSIEAAGPRPLPVPALLLGTAVSGAASFVYEIVWVRMISLAVGSTLHAFELMLASFIAGIAFGGLWVRSRADRVVSPLRLLGWLQLLMGLAALASIAVYAQSFHAVAWLIEALDRTDAGYALYNLGTAALAIAVMLPAAFFAGTTLPLFTLLLLRRGGGEAAVGRVYAWNTVGAIVGVLAAVHLLIPELGLKGALVLAAAVDLAVGVALLVAAAAGRGRGWTAAGAACGMSAAAVLGASLWLDLDPMRLASGVYRFGQPQLPPGDRIEFYRDGKTASVSVILGADGRRRIATNGKVDASLGPGGGSDTSTADEPTMVLAAAYPLAYHPEPRSAAVIGFGSGLTTHTLLADSRLERVDTIEIERRMVDGARLFGARVARAFTDARSHIFIDDAKSFLAASGRRYDLIVSEPSNPWISGVGALFSKEFYRFVPQYLGEDGLLLQWLQLYEIDDALVASILAALLPEVDDAHAFLVNSSDLLVLAKPRGRLAAPDFDRLLESPIATNLAQVGIFATEQLAFRKVADHALLSAIAAHYGSPPNSDYRPLLSLNAPRTRFRRQSADGLRSLATSPVPLLEWMGLRSPLDPSVDLLYARHFEPEYQTDAARALRALALRQPGDPLPAFATGQRQALRVLQQLGADCAGLASGRLDAEFASALAEFAGGVLPWLSGTELVGLLIDPVWLHCPLESELASLIELVGALALRDGRAVRALAPDWLEQRPAALAAFDAQALLGLLAAQWQAGELAALLNSHETWASRLRPGGAAERKAAYLLARARLELAATMR